MEPFKGKQFKVLTANTGSQDWMAPEQELANEVLKTSQAHLMNFQEITPKALNSFSSYIPHLRFVGGSIAGDLLINSQAFDTRRFKAIKSGNEWLSKVGAFGKLLDAAGERGFTWVEYEDLLTHQSLLMINVHLDNIGVRSRLESVLIILRFVHEFRKKHGPLPVIMAGDWNMSIDSPSKFGSSGVWLEPIRRKPYEIITKDFDDCWNATHKNGESHPNTYHGFQGLDYSLDEYDTADTDRIFVSKPKKGKVFLKIHNYNIIRQIYAGRFPSDHFWPIAHLEFITPEGLV